MPEDKEDKSTPKVEGAPDEETQEKPAAEKKEAVKGSLAKIDSGADAEASNEAAAGTDEPVSAGDSPTMAEGMSEAEKEEAKMEAEAEKDAKREAAE